MDLILNHGIIYNNVIRDMYIICFKCVYLRHSFFICLFVVFIFIPDAMRVKDTDMQDAEKEKQIHVVE